MIDKYLVLGTKRTVLLAQILSNRIVFSCAVKKKVTRNCLRKMKKRHFVE